MTRAEQLREGFIAFARVGLTVLTAAGHRSGQLGV